MADKSILDLDNQPSYNNNYYCEVHFDDGASPEADSKKMKLSVLAPRINELPSTPVFNPASDQLRTDNGSGAESKTTINEFIAAYLRSEVYQVGLYLSADLKATLILRKQLDAVNGLLYISPGYTGGFSIQDMEDIGSTVLELPTEFQPKTPGAAINGDGCHFLGESPDSVGGLTPNHLAIYYNGTNWRIALSIKDLAAAYKTRSFPVNYLANNDTLYTAP